MSKAADFVRSRVDINHAIVEESDRVVCKCGWSSADSDISHDEHKQDMINRLLSTPDLSKFDY